MIGYAVTVLIVVAGLLLSARPLARTGPLGAVSWLLSELVNESPSLALAYLLACAIPALVSGDFLTSGAVWWCAAGCASLAITPLLVRRSRQARPTLTRALDEAFGPDRPASPSRWRTRLPWWRIVAMPLPIFPAGVRRRSGIRYGPHRRHRLDVYTGRRHHGDEQPVLIHLHGGHFRSGRKSFYSRPLLHAFARNGWVCVSGSYRLRPATYTDMLNDTKRIIAWAREHVAEFGGDPRFIVVAGTSAGAHLAITAALIAGDERFQAGFENSDTSVRAAIGLSGYYGPADRGGPPSRPSAYAHPDAPPIMVVHGEQDTLVPPALQVDLVDKLRAMSTSPVVYANLPGAQHNFDLVHSLRSELVIDALWSFCELVRADLPAGRSTRPAGS